MYVIYTRDDHEITNNDYGNGTVEGTGAENHEEVCDPEDSRCERDEGPASIRFTDATQAYLEWLPIRLSEDLDTMGIVGIGNIAQRVEWGDLATFVAVDTRISGRTRENTLASGFDPFLPFAAQNLDISKYTTDLKDELDLVASNARAVLEDPQFTQIGSDLRAFVINAFKKSKQKKKPWQVFAASTQMVRLATGRNNRIVFLQHPSLERSMFEGSADFPRFQYTRFVCFNPVRSSYLAGYH